MLVLDSLFPVSAFVRNKKPIAAVFRKTATGRDGEVINQGRQKYLLIFFFNLRLARVCGGFGFNFFYCFIVRVSPFLLHRFRILLTHGPGLFCFLDDCLLLGLGMKKKIGSTSVRGNAHI